MKKTILITLMITAILITGCEESQKKVWGQGDPSAEYQGFFGNDNNARLNFIQSQAIDSLLKRVAKLEAVDPNE